MKRCAHVSTGYEPMLLQGHLQLTVPVYTSRLLSQLTIFAMQFGPLLFSNSNHGWSQEQMHVALTLS